MSYTYINSSILDPELQYQYCSNDGNYVVIPVVGKKIKYTTIIKGKPTGKNYRKFDTAMKDVLKFQKMM